MEPKNIDTTIEELFLTQSKDRGDHENFHRGVVYEHPKT